MKKNRIAYGILIAVAAVLLFGFSKTYILYLIIAFVAFAAGMVFILKRDADGITLDASINIDNNIDRNIQCVFKIESRKRLIATKSIMVEFELYNKMFDSTRHKTVIFELRDKRHMYEVPVETIMCGEVSVRCISVHAIDMLGIGKVRIPAFDASHVVVYPDRIKLNLLLDDIVTGASREDGIMQNRRGTDASEMFDIKEYTPGDDIRTIHWKLSEKLDKVIVRESSEPSHYDVALIPDFGHVNVDENVSFEELGKAVAMTAAVGEELAQQGISFCIMVPSDSGMYVHEIDSVHEYDRMISEILGFRIRENAGDGLKLFMSEHMEEYFTRVVIVSAGTYKQEFNGLEHQVGITVISVTKDVNKLSEINRDGAGMVEIPLEDESDDGYRIVI